MRKEYLGDSVYVELDDCGGIILTTENGFGPNNTIVLEPEVVVALNRYVESLRQEFPFDSKAHE